MAMDSAALPAVQGFHARGVRPPVRAHALDQGAFKAYQQILAAEDRTLVMIFEKASTRTRLSFEAGMHQLGGSAIYLNSRDSQLSAASRSRTRRR
jgi:ornithine carbamoyltransferase